MAIAVTTVFEKFLEKICTFENLNSFFDAHDYHSDDLEIFMKSDCLHTALIHNKTQKIKEHILKLDEKAFFSEGVIENIFSLMRPLILTTLEVRKKLHQYYRNLNEEEKLQFIGKLHLVQKEKRTHPRCPILIYLGTLGITNVRIEKEELANIKKIEKLTEKHKEYKLKCNEIIKEVNELLGIEPAQLNENVY